MSTILVVDDEDPIREFLMDSLKDEGYQTFGANNGEDGLREARANGPDLIILDVEMPKLDGFEVLRRLKEDETTRDIPVAMLTGRNAQGDVERAVQNMVDIFIPKPFNFDELLTSVKRIMASRGKA